MQTEWLIVGDVGENRYEEIDIINKRGNYGWHTVEGNTCFAPPTGCNFTGLTPPIFVYNHSLPFLTDGAAIIGGYIYRGESLPSLRGKYIFADYTGIVWALTFNEQNPYENSASIIIQKAGITISSFGLDQAGELYVVTLQGPVYQITM